MRAVRARPGLLPVRGRQATLRWRGHIPALARRHPSIEEISTIPRAGRPSAGTVIMRYFEEVLRILCQNGADVGVRDLAETSLI
jgi:hypothetical protein